MAVANDLGWFAGLFEGEGSIQIMRGHGATWLRVSVCMTDPEVVAEFHTRWPSNVNKSMLGKLLPSGRKKYWWELTAVRAADFLTDIQPYVRSTRVATKLALGLDFQSQKRIGGRGMRYRKTQLHYFDRMRALHTRSW